METAPRASIVLCTRNRAESLRATLLAILPLIEGDPGTELLVIDNGSTDATAQVCRDLCGDPQRLSYLCERTPGKGYAYNRALAEARGQVLLFTDDDVRPPTNWVERMVTPILRGNTDAVQGGVRIAESLQRPWMSELHRAWMGDTTGLDADRPAGLVGANMSVGRHVFEKVPAFDVELGPGALGFGDETLLGLQIKQAGFRIAGAMNCVVEHCFDPDRLSAAALRDRAVRQGRSEAYIAHHWEHVQPSPITWKHFARRAYLHGAHLLRPAGPPGWRELHYAAVTSYAAEMRRLGHVPHHYPQHGLVKVRGLGSEANAGSL